MAQGALSRYAAASAVLVGGAVIEALADQTLRAGLVDWAVGAALVLAGLARRRGRPDPVALLAGGLWFLATLALTPGGGWHDLAGPLALAYRGPVMHLLARPIAAGRLRLPVLVAAYIPPLLVSPRAGLVTAAVAAVLGVLVARRDLLAALVLGALAVTWAGTSVGALGEGAGDAALLLAASAVAFRHRTGGDRAMAGMVAELSQDARPSTPLSATLAEALGDPDLRVLIFAPDTGWRDDAGKPAPTPDLDDFRHRVTLTTVPGGGSLALIHGRNASTDTDLTVAAARAAVLVLERVRVGTQIRLTAEEVQRSGARLLAVDAQEREALGARLDAGPRRRLARVRALLDDGPPETPILERLDQADLELDRLARGLLPDAVAHRPLREALRALVDNGPLPVDLILEGPVDELPEQNRALVYFVTAEILTNAVRHSSAGQATLAVRVGSSLLLEFADNGVGGATVAPGHGLQNLADRITLAGGTFVVESPEGGPTSLTAKIPLPERA